MFFVTLFGTWLISFLLIGEVGRKIWKDHFATEKELLGLAFILFCLSFTLAGAVNGSGSADIVNGLNRPLQIMFETFGLVAIGFTFLIVGTPIMLAVLLPLFLMFSVYQFIMRMIFGDGE
jgi:hypothetical protein